MSENTKCLKCGSTKYNVHPACDDTEKLICAKCYSFIKYIRIGEVDAKEKTERRPEGESI